MNDKRKEFGSRYLTDESKVFEHNAWDDVEWNEDLESEAKEKVKANSTVTLTEKQLEDYERHAGKHWNDFYCQHQNKFFKDRHWLFTEFHELNGPTNDTESRDNDVTVNTDVPGSQASARIFEVGCGVGNTVFPILQTTDNPNLFVYCCDFAESAIDIVKEHELYNPERCHAFVCDVTDESAKLPVPECSLDFIVLIFVLSAVRPDRMLPTLQRLTKLLKPGGMFLFRDYGRYDMAQLRFKPGKCLQENFYARGDGTRVYFFTQDGTDELFTKCGLVKVENMVDRRLQVNRGRQLKMYRVWVQCKYMRPK